MLKFGAEVSRGLKVMAAQAAWRSSTELTLSHLLRINHVLLLPRRVSFKTLESVKKLGFLY